MTARNFDHLALVNSQESALSLWQRFSCKKWIEQFPWTELQSDGVYCQYCTQCTCTTSGASSSGSEVFVSKPFTGTRSDVLARHENSKHHELSVITYRERLERLSRHQQIQHIIQTQDLHVLTFDEEAFLDALRCLYVLGKQEISHTTNYLPFGNFCIRLGNNTLPRLQEAKNCTLHLNSL